MIMFLAVPGLTGEIGQPTKDSHAKYGFVKHEARHVGRSTNEMPEYWHVLEINTIEAKVSDAYHDPEKLDNKGLPLIPQPSDDPEDASLQNSSCLFDYAGSDHGAVCCSH